MRLVWEDWSRQPEKSVWLGRLIRDDPQLAQWQNHDISCAQLLAFRNRILLAEHELKNELEAGRLRPSAAVSESYEFFHEIHNRISDKMSRNYSAFKILSIEQLSESVLKSIKFVSMQKINGIGGVAFPFIKKLNDSMHSGVDIRGYGFDDLCLWAEHCTSGFLTTEHKEELMVLYLNIRNDLLKRGLSFELPMQ